MSGESPFSPHYGAGINVTAGAASDNAALPKGSNQVRVINTGSNSGQVRIGQGASLAATANDLHLLANQEIVLTRQTDDDRIAFISAAGTTFNVIPGQGYI